MSSWVRKVKPNVQSQPLGWFSVICRWTFFDLLIWHFNIKNPRMRAKILTLICCDLELFTIIFLKFVQGVYTRRSLRSLSIWAFGDSRTIWISTLHNPKLHVKTYFIFSEPRVSICFFSKIFFNSLFHSQSDSFYKYMTVGEDKALLCNHLKCILPAGLFLPILTLVAKSLKAGYKTQPCRNKHHIRKQVCLQNKLIRVNLK